MRQSGIGDFFRRRRTANDLAAASGIHADEVEERWNAQAREAQELISEARELPSRIDRREFLVRASRAGSLLVGTSALAVMAAACSTDKPTAATATPPPTTAGGGPRIVVVGAGLAGLTTAYRLMQAGHSVTVYEGNDRVGGRAHTLRNFFDDEDTVELCGEYINSDQMRIRDLAAELGLEETNLWSSYPSGVSGLYWFDGKPYSRIDAHAGFDQMYPALVRDKKAAGYPTTWERSTPAGRALDNMTLSQWIERNIDGGMSSTYGRLVDVAYTGEYGLDPDDQSALNIVYEAGFSKPGDHKLYGYQDWKWSITGGNDLVASRMVEELPAGSVQMQMPLVAVRSNTDGTTTLTFDGGGSPTDVTADIAIMALPFTTLRDVDIEQTDWSDLKRRTIDELGMGTNSKLHLQFSKPVWNEQGISGDITTERPLESTTIVFPVNGPAGILDNYKGGVGGAGYSVTEPFSAVGPEVADPALDELDKIVQGVKSEWNGKAYLSNLVANPWSVGSYSCPRPGEYSTIFGAAMIPEGKVLFCGEHTSINSFGFLEGAVETGERAAMEAQALL